MAAECIRMLNGPEKALEKKLPVKERRWEVAEAHTEYGNNEGTSPPG